jgi:hypothetical protein
MTENNNRDEEDYLSANSMLSSTLNPPLNEGQVQSNHKNRNGFVLILFLIVLFLAANQYFGWIVPKNLNDAITSQSILGRQGERGPAGKDGIIGKDGAPGARGAQGQKGATGPQGPSGTSGTSGSDGATGATGPTGPAGSGGGGNGGNGTGTVTLGTCDSDITVSVSSKYVPYSGTIANNWVVDVLTISNIDATACNGKRVTVVLLQSNGSVIVTSNQLTISGTSLAFNCTPDATGACTGGGFPSTPILRSNLLDSVTLEVAA